MSYKVGLDMDQKSVILVGCGGTGSIVADGLCRLLGNSGIRLLLVDHDRVEPHNLRRQAFFEEDVGKFKSQVLAERLARQYGRVIGYRVYPFDEDTMSEPAGRLGRSLSQGIIIGCVDNAAARREIAKNLRGEMWGVWWIDAGNGHNSGQVLIGNVISVAGMEGAFHAPSETVSSLPAPSLQLPSLLAPPTTPVPRRGCAEAVEAEEQSPVINQAMATLVLEFMYRILKEELTWMGAYIDLGAGTLRTVPAEPDIVARMLSIKVDTLVDRSCSRGIMLRR